MVQFNCSHCGQKIKAPNEYLDKKVKCPKCGQSIAVSSPPVGSTKLVDSCVEELLEQDKRESKENTFAYRKRPSAPDVTSQHPAGESSKKCPYCGEVILAVAHKCKHCKSDLTGSNDKKHMSKKSWMILSAVVITVGILLSIVLIQIALKARQSDPKIVAMGFLLAAADQSLERTASYIIADEREVFKKTFLGEIDLLSIKIPQTPTIRVEVKDVWGVKTAEVEVINAEGPLGFDMKFVDGKWWVSK